MKHAKYILLPILFLLPGFLLNGCSRANTYAPVANAEEAFDYTKARQTLTSHVSDTVSRVENTMPSGTPAEQQSQFFALKHEIETVEKELEEYDHQLENGFLNNSLSLKDYQIYNARLDNLEDLLDSAEERLDFSFGMEL
ncbi:hypothetical protein ABXS75_18590 [Roseburia hominis]